MDTEKRLAADAVNNVREVGGFLVYETARLRLMFSAEKKQSLIGTLRLENVATKRFYMDRFNLALAPRRKAFIKEAVTKIELSMGEIETLLDQFIEELTKEKTESSVVIQIPDQDREWGESFLKNKIKIGIVMSKIFL